MSGGGCIIVVADAEIEEVDDRYAKGSRKCRTNLYLRLHPSATVSDNFYTMLYTMVSDMIWRCNFFKLPCLTIISYLCR
jgi:hypothetical protein